MPLDNPTDLTVRVDTQHGMVFRAGPCNSGTHAQFVEASLRDTLIYFDCLPKTPTVRSEVHKALERWTDEHPDLKCSFQYTDIPAY